LTTLNNTNRTDQIGTITSSPRATQWQSEQEAFWAGEFGNQYIDRNCDERSVASNINLFSEGLRRADGIKSALEVGCNVGLNLSAIAALFPSVKLSGFDINPRAVEFARKRLPNAYIGVGSLVQGHQEFGAYDLVVIKGVLIHIAPELLAKAYTTVYEIAKKWVFLCEYYNPTPVEISYRGHAERLFKRDFAGELLDRYPDLRLRDYGFRYRRDALWPADDLTWFLLEKTPVAP
jgi:pseudaminic acid biosynthesis-associated methylase